MSKPTQEQIELAAAAIANARGGRRGMPPVSNVLEMLEGVAPTLHAEVIEDAEAALTAVFDAEDTVHFLIKRSVGGREQFRTADGWTAVRGAARLFDHMEAPVELDRLEKEEGAEGCSITSA